MLNNFRYICFYAITFLVLIGMIVFGLEYPVVPYSDFAYHWTATIDLSQYIKGGALVLFYKIPYLLGFSSSTSATIINSISWLLFSYSIRPSYLSKESNTRSNRKMASSVLYLIFLLAYCLFATWWILTVSTVEVMTCHLGFFCFALRLYFDFRKLTYFIISFIIAGLALSMRMQSVLIFIPFIIISSIYILCYSKNNNFAKYLIAWFVISCVFGISIEATLRKNSNQKNEITINERLPLYSGLLSPTAKDRCGGWSPEAAELTIQEIDENIFTLTVKHLKEKSLNDIWNLILCKYKRLLYKDRHIAGWIPQIAHIDIMKKTEMQKFYHFVTKLERYIDIILRILVYLLLASMIWTIIKTKKFTICDLLTFSTILGFLGVITIFELNPRYIIIIVGYILFFYTLKKNESYSH